MLFETIFTILLPNLLYKFIDAHFSIRPKIAFYVLQKGMLGKLVRNVAKTILESIVFKTIADIPKQLIACLMAGSSHFEAFC